MRFTKSLKDDMLKELYIDAELEAMDVSFEDFKKTIYKALRGVSRKATIEEALKKQTAKLENKLRLLNKRKDRLERKLKRLDK